jgi:SurA-like N-terminal domain
MLGATVRHCLIILLIVLLLPCGYGCQSESNVEHNAVLMAVGQRAFRLDEFERAYRVFRSAHGIGLEEDPATERSSKLRFIHQLADQLVLLEYAHDTGLGVSDDALNKAVEDIRGDYPDDLFEQMLLENAVNFEDWKHALRVRLTIDRLIQQELTANVQITEKDIEVYYQHLDDEQLAPPSPLEGEGADQIDQMIIQQLRRQKTEQAYAPWMENLRAKYPVEIDQIVVQQIIADSGVPVEDGGERAP